MAYTVNNIATKADCDVLLSIANKEKSDLAFRKLSLERQQSTYSTNSVEINAELTAINAEVNALTTIVNSLPDGDLKNEQLAKLKRAELKQFLLTDRKDDYGAVALLNKEFDLARVEKELEECDIFIAAIEARKTAIV